FRLSEGSKACWVEVKSVTYVEDGIGRFPDAPTSRGRKHLGELANLIASGDRASVVFIAQREDALQFAPFEAVDPAFSQTLREANAKGVEVHAYVCCVSTERIEINRELPVLLGA
ncbi:MAG TPA: DNA/RNA nuclease SfsA, partial [Brevefilum sp.]